MSDLMCRLSDLKKEKRELKEQNKELRECLFDEIVNGASTDEDWEQAKELLQKTKNNE